MISAPGVQPGRCSAVTQNIDVLPTVMEYYEISQEVLQYPIHGKSLLPLLRGLLPHKLKFLLPLLRTKQTDSAP